MRYENSIVCQGTTSACAENTHLLSLYMIEYGNYLRVRGEYSQCQSSSPPTTELPPRARRIPTHPGSLFTNYGTTSACAENTPHTPLPGRRNRNYLRVRGEYIVPIILSVLTVELPPRARRIPEKELSLDTEIGTTSACAENTSVWTLTNRRAWNYLRVRGEYPK